MNQQFHFWHIHKRTETTDLTRDTETVRNTGGKGGGGGRRGERGVNGDGGRCDHTMQHRGEVLQIRTPETYTILLT